MRLSKDQIEKLSMKQLENRVFVFDSSPADEKIFRTRIAEWLNNRQNDSREFYDLLWDLTAEVNQAKQTIKYLYFNERAQRCYLDWFFVEWANRASEEICQTLEKMHSAPN